MIVPCKYCGFNTDKPNGAVNRAIKSGLNIFCNRECAGLYRRKNKSESENKEHKRLYDIQYRAKNNDSLKIKKDKYNKSKAGRATQKRNRDKRKTQHLEYCRTDKYTVYKKIYDRVRVAKMNHGEFWECAVLTLQIADEVDNRQAVFDKGTFNKAQKRANNINY